MVHRIVELLVLLMDEFGGSGPQVDQMDHISEDLLRRGYTEQEINAAFYWLSQRFVQKASVGATKSLDVQKPADSSYRVLSPLEQRYVTPEAFGHLLHLQSLKLIGARELERILERILILDLAPAGLEDVKMVTQSVLLEDQESWQSAMRTPGSAGTREIFH